MFRRRLGFTLIELLVVIAIIGVLIALLLPAIQAAREAARRSQCENNMKQFGLAVHNYLSNYGEFPGANTRWNSGVNCRNGGWSVHSKLLPFLDQEALYNKINFSIRANGDATSCGPGGVNPYGLNTTATSTPVASFLCPSDPPTSLLSTQEIPSGSGNNVPADRRNSYRFCSGTRGDLTNGVFGRDVTARGFTEAQVLDGLSNTVALSEVLLGSSYTSLRTGNRWNMHINEITTVGVGVLGIDPVATARYEACVASTTPATYTTYQTGQGGSWRYHRFTNTLYMHQSTPNGPRCTAFRTRDPQRRGYRVAVSGPSSNHPGGVNALFLDGKVHFITESISFHVFQALATRAGEESDHGF